MPASELLDERLDTGFYSPAYFDARAKLSATGFDSQPIGRLCEPWQFGAYALCNHIEWSDERYGVPYVKAEALGSPLVNRPGLSYITRQTHELLKKSKVGPGDIVVSTSGTIGLCAVWPVSLGQGNSNQDTIKFNPKNDEFDNYFLAAWLACRFGQTFLRREAGGGVQQHVYLYNFKRIPLPKPHVRAQRYIGDKVRQAERLREIAAQRLSEATSLLEECLRWNSNLSKPHRFRRLSVAEMQDRLDGNFNSPARLYLRDHLSTNHVTLAPLAELADTSAMIGWKGLTTEHYTETGPWLLRGVEITDGVIDFDALVSVTQDKYDEQPQIHVQKGDVALSKDGTIGKAAVIPDLPQAMAVGSTVARLRLRSEDSISPYYLEHALNHEVLQIQIRSVATGMAQPHITQEWIERLQVPRCSEEGKISELVRRHHNAIALAKDLTLTARFLVEGLIEGRVTESDLIAVHKAVEGRDFHGERSLLTRITRKGIDIPGAPGMFPSLDALYQSLDDAQFSVNMEVK